MNGFKQTSNYVEVNQIPNSNWKSSVEINSSKPVWK